MFRMEVDKLLSQTQYALPVGIVLILAAFVFVFGFKTVAEPKFSDRTSSEEKKAKKQLKAKDTKKKIQSNGNTDPKTIREKRSSDDEKVAGNLIQSSSPAKTVKKDAKKVGAEKKPVDAPETKKAAAAPKVKAPPKPKESKPEDFDEGEWVQAVNKRDRKQRKGEVQAPEVTVAAANAAPKKKTKAAKEPTKKEEKVVAVEEVAAPAVEVEIVAETAAVDSVEILTEVEPEPPVTQEADLVDEPTAEVVEVTVEEKTPEESEPQIELKIEAKPEKNRNKKGTKNVSKETNNNESVTPAPNAASVEEIENDIIEAEKPVISEAAEPAKIEIEDQWQEIQAPKKKKKARRE